MRVLDGIGIYGTVWNHSIFFALFGSTCLLFFYFWKKGRLDMDEDVKNQVLVGESQDDYNLPVSKEGKVPLLLKLSYILLPVVGVVIFYLYWNGSSGWLDRGYWKQLQEAANTTNLNF